MKFPKPRVGEPVKVHGREVEFSMWPVRRARAGATLNARLFIADPWPVMMNAIERLPAKEERAAGRAFLEQGQDFYGAAWSASTTAARPLLLYYAFLNVAKALILVRLPGTSLDGARHGLGERLRRGRRELLDAYLEVSPTAGRPEIFDLLRTSLTRAGFTSSASLDIPVLLRQTVTGHRLFLAAASTGTENFLALQCVRFLHDPDTQQIWLRMESTTEDLSRLGISQHTLIQRSNLSPDWRLTASPKNASPPQVLLELANPLQYDRGWISDRIMPLVDMLRHSLWQAVLSVPPYRRYYLFAPPVAESPFVLPQILSAYALFFYFGSITRYRPHHFDRILAGRYGALVEGFLHDQPAQMLFLFASEFAQREVSRSAIV